MIRSRPATYLPAILIVLFGLTFQVSGYPLLDPDEGRNAEIAREMAEANDYVVPRLNGLPYIDKPVLYFAATAGVMEVLGPTVLAARLPSLVFTLGTLVLVAWFGYRGYGGAGGWTAALATATMPLTLAFSRTVIFDSALTLFVTAACMAFYLALEAKEEREDQTIKRRAEGAGPPGAWWVTVGWVAIALGILTKGPIALALPLLVAVPFAVWRKRTRRLGDVVAILACTVLILPWLLAMSRAVPGFLDHALVTETVKRLATDELGRTGPLWYFFPILLAGTLPWSLVVLGALPRWRRAHPTTAGARRPAVDGRLVYLVLWIVVPLLFFTLSQSKRPQYVLPMLPPVGLLVAHLWYRDTVATQTRRLHGARVAGAALAGVAAVLLAAPPLVRSLLDVSPNIADAIPRTGMTLGSVTLVVAVGVWLASRRPVLLVTLLAIPVSMIPLAGIPLMRAIGVERSAAGLAAVIRPRLSPQTQVIAIETFPLSLPFYLRRPLILTTTDARELTSNFLPTIYDRLVDRPDSPLRPSDWWREALLACHRPRIFIARPDDRDTRALLEQRLPLLVEAPKAAAYGPCQESELATIRGGRPAASLGSHR